MVQQNMVYHDYVDGIPPVKHHQSALVLSIDPWCWLDDREL